MPGPLTELSPDEQLFRDSVRRFAREQVAPRAKQMDEAEEFDAELLHQLFEQGLMGIGIPEEFEGQGGSVFDSVLAIEEMAAADPATAVVVDVQNTLVNAALLRWGTGEQKREHLPKLATGSVGAYALSEAGAGSDAFALTARAVAADGGYRLTGRKLWTTNAVEASLFLIFATADPAAGYKGITCFLVHKGQDGLEVGRKEQKLGIRASSTCELILDGVFVEAGNILGRPGQGYKIAIETLNEGRIGIGAQMLGLAQGALDHAAGYVTERRQFGKALAEFQAIQMELARMATDIEAARLLTYNAARLCDANQPFLKEAAMAKYFASQIAETVASRAIELFGGVGYTRDYPVEKLYRDAKIGRIYEGTSTMQLLTIAKQLLRK